MDVLRVSSFLSSFVLGLAASLSVAMVAVQIGLRLLAGDLQLRPALLVLLLAPDVYTCRCQLGAAHHAAEEPRCHLRGARRPRPGAGGWRGRLPVARHDWRSAG
jgi:ABC-type transport system involved in cytochrome bd biosynthesis fused ATPase/permease subunit